jgi:hypothetical protein
MWLHIPKTSYPSTQVEEDSTLDLEWLFPMLEQSVTWREKFRQSLSWSKALKTNSWMMPLFGQIPQPLIAKHGLEKWIGSLEDSLANHGQLQEKEKEKKTKDGSGMTSVNSFAHYDQKDSSWKTFQVSLLDMELTPYSESFPKWGMMQDGEVSRLQMSELPTGENVYSYWRTSQASDGEGVNSRYKLRDHSANVVANWATPQARDHNEGITKETLTRKDGKLRNDRVEVQGKILLDSIHQAQTQNNGQTSSENTQDSPQPWKNLRLNPMFVEWLMGLPIGYTELTDLEYSEMESYHFKQLTHLEHLLKKYKS